MTFATCPEPCVMPIVFVPGIMGSRLRRRGGPLVWDPDNSIDWNPFAESQGSLDPEGDPSGRAARAQSMLQIAKARQFDQALAGNGFHPDTRMFYADDSGHPSWDKVVWRQNGPRDTASAGATYRNRGLGTVEWGEWLCRLMARSSLLAKVHPTRPRPQRARREPDGRVRRNRIFPVSKTTVFRRAGKKPTDAL